MDRCACKQQKVVIAGDRISDLLENIRSRILSCLPTKDAVRTSVLSTRWKYMWTTITDLHFDDKLLYSGKQRSKREYFMNFVERVLLHLDSSSINTFFLKCNYDSYNASRFNAWITTVLRRNVRKLDIQYMVRDLLIPRSICNSDCLVELKLATYSTLKVHSSLHLSKLKILDLSYVKILNESFPHSNQLLLNFPVLETFRASYCTWSNAKTVIINSPSLERFMMSKSKYEGIPSGSHKCAVKVLTPCLTEFTYSGYLSEEFILPSPSLVLHATIRLSLDQNTDPVREVGLQACVLLKHFSCLNHLTLEDDGRTKEAIIHAKDVVSDLPIFDKLIHLELNSGLFAIETLMNFLHNSPMLESLIVHAMFHFEDDILASPKMPYCILFHLNVIRFTLIWVREHELSLVKYLLENAKVLEEMIVTFSSCWSRKLANICKMQILKFPKGSSQARIVFS